MPSVPQIAQNAEARYEQIEVINERGGDTEKHYKKKDLGPYSEKKDTLRSLLG